MIGLLDDAVRVMKAGGALYLYHLPSWGVTLGAHLRAKLQFQHWIAISMKNGFVRGRRLYPAHYSLLFFTKGQPATFERPRLPLEYCACGRTKKDYGGYLRILQEKGINLSDIWDDISPVRHRHKKRRKANELPLKVTERVVAISGARGLTYVDPFAGAGAGVLAAAKAGMIVKSCDIVPGNAAAQVRALDQMLKVRMVPQ